MTTPRNTLAAKAIYMVYGFPGKVKTGWEAERLDEKHFRIHRTNDTYRDISLQSDMRTAYGDVRPEVHESGVLCIGDHSVVIGRGIEHGMHARKLGGANQYLVFNKDMTQLGRFKIGEKYDGSPVSLVDAHLLKMGDKIIPIYPRQYEITLLVMDTEVTGGKLAYINMIEKGNKLNRKDGTKGVFYPPRREGEPCRFIERVGDDNLLTAVFYLSKNGKRLEFRHRSAESALKEMRAKEALYKAKEEAIMAGIAPEEYHEYVEASDRFNKIQADWKEVGMAVNFGAEMFYSPEKREEMGYKGP